MGIKKKTGLFESDPIECPNCHGWGPHKWLNKKMTRWLCVSCKTYFNAEIQNKIEIEDAEA